MAYLGFDEFATYKLSGGSATTFGFTDDGDIGTSEQDVEFRKGIGGQICPVWGMVIPRANVRGIYKGEDFLDNCAANSAGALPPLFESIAGGILGVTLLAYDLQTAYVDRIRVSCGGQGSPIEYEIDFVGLGIANTYVTTVTPNATADYVGYWGAVTLAGAAFEVQDWEVELNNNLRAEGDCDVKINGTRRLPTTIEPGEVAARARLTMKLPLENLGLFDDIPNLPIATMSVAIGNGYTTKTITLRDLWITNRPVPLEESDSNVLFEAELRTTPNLLGASGTANWEVS